MLQPISNSNEHGTVPVVRDASEVLGGQVFAYLWRVDVDESEFLQR